MRSRSFAGAQVGIAGATRRYGLYTRIAARALDEAVISAFSSTLIEWFILPTQLKIISRDGR